MTERDFHPIADLFPLMEAADLDDLAADIREHDLREPIWLHPDGRIIDGRNRSLACEIAGVEPRFQRWDGKGSLAAFVVSLNLKRRHLTTSQRAMVAEKLATMTQGTRTDLGPIGTMSAAQAGNALSVSERAVKRARKVRKHGDPDLVSAVESGKKSVHAAEKEVREPELPSPREANERARRMPAQNIVFNAEAQEIRRSFERRAQDLVELEALSPQLAAFCGKLDGLFARLALTLHCCDSQPPADQINADVARRVTQLMRATIIPHALRFYLDSETGILADARSIAGWILGKNVERLTFGDLTTSVRPCRGKSRDEVCRMLEPLEMFNWIFPDDLNHPRAWAVNLQVHERFADRAEQERGRRERMRDLLKESASHE